MHRKKNYMANIYELKSYVNKQVEIKGWITNSRSSKGIEFIVIRDGSGFLQCIADVNECGEEVYEIAKKLTQESAVEIIGNVIEDPKQIGGIELHITNIKIVHLPDNYPISNKNHGVQFLMDNRHLWLRSKRQWAIMRIRNSIIYAIHNFFQKEGFMQMDAPIFMGNAAEGTSTLFETKFYDEPAYLSQSGQLYGEAMAMAMGKIYTFGPTFRAEKSKTRRHLSEFWMIEPEMAFFDNKMNMDLIERFIKSVVKEVIDRCKFELVEFLERDIDSLQKVVDIPFYRVSYDNAVKLVRGEEKINGITTMEIFDKDISTFTNRLKEIESELKEKENAIKVSNINENKKNFIQNKIDILKNEKDELEEALNHIPAWKESAKNFEYGNDFGGSDETILTRLFEVPVMVYNWPKEIKAFYMKRAEDNDNLVKGVDVLAPQGFGEIVGGSERETDINLLLERIAEQGLNQKDYEWYLDLRRFGSVPHSGFGLGLERFVSWITNTKHIRETIPFPRMYGRIHP